MADMMSEIGEDEALMAFEGRGDSIDLEELATPAEDNKVVRLLNLVLLQAIKDKASDIHFEPFEDEFKMRYRIDGVLYEMIPPPRAPGAADRLPHQGHGQPRHRRAAAAPGRPHRAGGQQARSTCASRSCRRCSASRSSCVCSTGRTFSSSLDKIGLRDDELEELRGLIQKPNGIVIVTGPTGSGKTTTLYAALQRAQRADDKILTAEDPVEYDIDGLIQCQVNTEQDLTFARLLRSFLRQDPDIILIGEIRDLETAQIAVQASLTGHLVFSTLHTNDAPSSILRLVDLGMEPFLLTATIEAIVAQRLVRRICISARRSTPRRTSS